ncbi:hypothetical protein BKA70DRAFT_1345590 [Coprinopsis sp. MPI-PUGE-AT-0042]|nr:hypothetical protein BKA70DRAFT_1345590 [Coprinopsis sp. MPI-PUGE-AT-0042]
MASNVRSFTWVGNRHRKSCLTRASLIASDLHLTILLVLPQLEAQWCNQAIEIICLRPIIAGACSQDHPPFAASANYGFGNPQVPAFPCCLGCPSCSSGSLFEVFGFFGNRDEHAVAAYRWFFKGFHVISPLRRRLDLIIAGHKADNAHMTKNYML